jgi:6-phosphogluconolactonase
MSERPEIFVAKDPGELSQRAAASLSESISRSIAARGVCLIALAGGETPRSVYRLLGRDPLRSSIDWEHVHLFFGDERMVPPDDPASNYGMVVKELVSCIRIPHANVHRIRGEAPADDAAREYETDLQQWAEGGLLRFDVVLLGIGEDGHLASLFPETVSLTEVARMAMGYFVPKLNSWRVTLTFPVLRNAREIVFLATGSRKAAMVATIIESTDPQTDVPATMLGPTRGRVHWMLDEEAASLLH